VRLNKMQPNNAINLPLPKPVRLLLSSPGGLDKHRQVVRDVIAKMNAHSGDATQPIIEVVEWPRSIAAAASSYSQGAINEQTLTYDILLCLFSHRIGTQTPRANSATEEEFDRAYESHLLRNDKQILVLFADLLCRPSDIDPHQLALVNAFRQKLERLGVLYHTYGDLATLAQHLATSLEYARNRAGTNQTATPQRHASVASENPRPEVIRFIGTRVLSSRLFNPQWADYIVIPLAEYRKANVLLRWTFATEAAYFRQGFKLADCREPILSSGGVQTHGMNLLIHLGRNGADQRWFVSPYRHGLRVGPDSPIANTVGLRSANCELAVSASGEIQFSIDGKTVHAEYFPLDGIPQVTLMAWGDEHSFECELRDITILA
jgi:hypothetical protein